MPTDKNARLIAKHLSRSEIPTRNAMQAQLAEQRLSDDTALVSALADLAGLDLDALALRLAHENARAEVCAQERETADTDAS